MRTPTPILVRPRGRDISKRIRGLTLVELLVSVLLLATTVALALPSYREMTEKRQLTQGAEQIQAYLNSIHGLSSRSNDTVTVSYSRTDNSNWCFGAVLGDTACDCSETDASQPDFCGIDGAPSRITNDNTGNLGILQAVNGDGAFTYEPVRGLFVDLGDSLDIELHSPGGGYQLRLMLLATGQSHLCSKDKNHHVPGYELCPVAEEEESKEL